MAQLAVRRFSTPAALRRMSAHALLALLNPYAVYFRDRGVPLREDAEALDYKALAAVLIAPDETTPPGLIDDLYYVDEMATSEGMDDLRFTRGATAAGVPRSTWVSKTGDGIESTISVQRALKSLTTTAPQSGAAEPEKARELVGILQRLPRLPFWRPANAIRQRSVPARARARRAGAVVVGIILSTVRPAAGGAPPLPAIGPVGDQDQNDQGHAANREGIPDHRLSVAKLLLHELVNPRILSLPRSRPSYRMLPPATS